MEKYGAELDNDKVKEAGQGKNPNACPLCGKDAGESKNCPEHGTLGFEKTIDPVRTGRFSTTKSKSNLPRPEQE